MPAVQVQWKAHLENVASVKVQEDYTWSLKVKCTGCNEEHDKWVEVTAAETTAMPGSKGEANLVMKCKFCRRDMSLDVVEHREPGLDPDVPEFVPLATFNGRGVDAVAFRFGMGFRVGSAASSTTFDGVDLSENEWTEYDDEGKAPLSITELQYKFVKLK